MIYVLSDIHGNERRFNSILEQINLQAEDTLYILGDVIDRHPNGIRLLQRIMTMPNAKMLLGNHEHMMIRALGHPYNLYDTSNIQTQLRAMQDWYRNGGSITHQHWKQLSGDQQSDILQFLRSLPLNINVELNGTIYKLVHGSPIESAGAWEDPTYFTLWNRWSVLDTVPDDYTMIFGHTPSEYYYQDDTPMKIWFGNRCIGIDCGSSYPDDSPLGRLACLRLDDGEVFYSEEGSHDY